MADVANRIGVSQHSLYEWLKRYSLSTSRPSPSPGSSSRSSIMFGGCSVTFGFRLPARALWRGCKDFGGIWNSPLWQKELIGKALLALHMFQRDQHYIVVANKVQIVDEFTGRVAPDHTWEGGLHQMIEAKEKCEITGQRRTLSQITYQRFFGRYLLLAGMTGTAKEVGAELKRVYNLDVTSVPTHKPTRRLRLPDRIFRTSDERWQEVAARAEAVAEEGRAVLVGTRSVEASEILSQFLAARGVAHTVLNARQDKEEADAIGQAGMRPVPVVLMQPERQMLDALIE